MPSRCTYKFKKGKNKGKRCETKTEHKSKVCASHRKKPSRKQFVVKEIDFDKKDNTVEILSKWDKYLIDSLYSLKSKKMIMLFIRIETKKGIYKWAKPKEYVKFQSKSFQDKYVNDLWTDERIRKIIKKNNILRIPKDFKKK